jgi:hypothetical protein
LSDAQAAIRDHLMRCGFAYMRTASTSEAIAWLKVRGVPRGGFEVQ